MTIEGNYAMISCYNENKELEHFKVLNSVYVYIRQLENEIRRG